jgi:hypothetical protein
MSNGEFDIQDRMLAYVCGSLDPLERATFEDRMAEDAEIARQVAALRRLLSSLDAWDTPEPSPSFVDDVIRRVERVSPLEYIAATTSVAPDRAAGPTRRYRISLREVLTAAACITLVMSLLMPGVRQRRNQALCEMNLAGFGQGLSQYAAMFDGALPSVGRSPNANWMQQPNRVHLVPAIQLGVLQPSHLVCPTSPGGRIDNEAAMRDIEAFVRSAGGQVQWYSYQNANGPLPHMIARIRIPVAADLNPRFPNGQFDPNVPSAANSHVHGGRGQNVLFIDQSTKFLRSPVVGETADNIYEAEDVRQYTGTETQRSATDAFLIP